MWASMCARASYESRDEERTSKSDYSLMREVQPGDGDSAKM